MISLIKALWQAWQAGQIVAKPAMWKSVGELSLQVGIIISGICSLVIFFVPGAAEWLSPQAQALLTTIAVSVFGLFSIIIGRTTTNKEVGLNVLIENKSEPQGIQGKDIPASQNDGHPGDNKNVGATSGLGSVDRKAVPQGQDVI